MVRQFSKLGAGMRAPGAYSSNYFNLVSDLIDFLFFYRNVNFGYTIVFLPGLMA